MISRNPISAPTTLLLKSLTFQSRFGSRISSSEFAKRLEPFIKKAGEENKEKPHKESSSSSQDSESQKSSSESFPPPSKNPEKDHKESSSSSQDSESHKSSSESLLPLPPPPKTPAALVTELPVESKLNSALTKNEWKNFKQLLSVYRANKILEIKEGDNSKFAAWHNPIHNAFIIQGYTEWQASIPNNKLGLKFEENGDRISVQFIDSSGLAINGSVTFDLEGGSEEKGIQLEAFYPVIRDVINAVVKKQKALEFFLNPTAAVMDKRKPLMDELKKYFCLDEKGYILGMKSDVVFDDVESYFGKNEAVIANLFYDISKTGDAAYAEDIRTALAGLNIGSTPVNKDQGNKTGKSHDIKNVRPQVMSKGKVN